jgi:hypothetical protein
LSQFFMHSFLGKLHANSLKLEYRAVIVIHLCVIQSSDLILT